MADAIVIGAGVGGLAAALRLAVAGWSVQVFDGAQRAGGKAGIEVVDGVAFDTGPSLVTLPQVFDELFRMAGTTLEERLELVRPEPAFRYRFPDGRVLDLHQDPEESAGSVASVLGGDAADDFRSMLAYCRAIWETAAPPFIFDEAPGPGTLLRHLPTLLPALSRIDPFRTMQAAIDKRVRDPALRQIFHRFATYNGSDYRRAPATLNCIAWVELGLGAYGIAGGLYALVEALEEVAREHGVVFRYGARVHEVLVEGGRAVGVRTDEGLQRADAVISNADVQHLIKELLPATASHGLRERTGASMSGWTGVLRARRRAGRVAHEVLFCEDYAQEFVDVFDEHRVPVDPTIYCCAQSVGHQRPGWEDHEPLFAMINAPAGAPLDMDAMALHVHTRLLDAGMIDADDALVWSRGPDGLAKRFPGTDGAIYGAASNTLTAAFQRPANRVGRVGGLYLASGSAHPGGGLPLCALSGRMAAELAHKDLQ